VGQVQVVINIFQSSRPDYAPNTGDWMTDLAAPARGAGTLRDLTARRPLTVFVALVLGLGWTILSLMVLAARGVIPLGGAPPELFILVVNLGVMLPAALWVTSVTDGPSGVRALLTRSRRWRFKPVWWAVVLLALPALTTAAAFLLGGSFRPGNLTGTVVKQLASTLFAVGLIHLWEETVWGGFLQTRLERRHNFFLAAVLAALPFAGVHVPLLLMADPLTPSGVLAGLAGLLALAVVARTMWGVVLRGAADSTLAIGLMHGVFNASNNQGQLLDSVLETASIGTAAMIALVILTVLLVAFNRAKLTRSYRLEVLERPPAPGG
jgi:membrane protease YdiL (CAAX protease family)